MAPTKRKLEKTNVGEEVLDLVIPYIHNVEDRSSVYLVSRKCYETDGITRKRVTVHVHYCPNPSRLSKRFPFIESLTLKGPLSYTNVTNDYAIRITPWIQQLALEFRCFKELRICGLIVHDDNLETLARIRGKELRSLKIEKCEGFSTDGLRHVSNCCNQLRTLSLENVYHIEVKDGIWLHQLALNSTVLERLHVKNTNIFDDGIWLHQLRTLSLEYCYHRMKDGIWLHQLALNSKVLERLHVKNTDIYNNAEDLTLLAKKCCNSLISLKIGECFLSKLGDAFRYAVRLEHFGGYICDEESELVGFQFPPNTHSLSMEDLPLTGYPSVLPLLNQIRKLKLVFVDLDDECLCLLFKRCPNLEVLYTKDVCGDRGLQVIGKFCKKLHKLTHIGLVTHVGLIALAKGCTKLECLEVRLGDISNEALKCLGTHLKNLRKLRINVVKKDGTTDLPLDNGIQAMLMGCSKLERLHISLWHQALTDVGLEYIGKYGANLRSLSLTRIGNSNAGLVKLSEGCPRLRKLTLSCCPVSKIAVVSSVFKIPSLRYVWFDSWDRSDGSDRISLALTRPEF